MLGPYSLRLLVLAPLLVACGPPDPGAVGQSESGESGESGDSTDSTGADEPDEPLPGTGCWETFGVGSNSELWAGSIEQLLVPTHDGLVRVNGDAIDSFAVEHRFDDIWASDIDNAWVVESITNGNIVDSSILWRFEDGVFEPWPEPAEADVLISTIEGRAADDVWLVAWDLSGTRLHHWDGTSWAVVDAQQIGLEAFESGVPYLADSDGERVYFGGAGDVLTLENGSAGIIPDPQLFGGGSIELEAFAPGQVAMASLWCDFVCVEDHMWWNGTSWHTAPSASLTVEIDEEVNLVDIDGLGDGVLWAMYTGWYGYLARYEAGTRQQIAAPPEFTYPRVVATSDGLVAHGDYMSSRASYSCLLESR